MVDSNWDALEWLPAALSSRLRISVRNVLIVASTKCASIGVNSFSDATHASCSAEVERNQNNHVAHFVRMTAVGPKAYPALGCVLTKPKLLISAAGTSFGRFPLTIFVNL